MKLFISDFKAFALKGNVFDLAIAVVIGTAFGKIVSSLVTNIITPMIGVLMGGVNFTELEAQFGEAVINYGVFLQSIFDFIIVAFVIFLAIKTFARLQSEFDKKEEVEKEEAKPKPVDSEEVKLLREIRDNLIK